MTYLYYTVICVFLFLSGGPGDQPLNVRAFGATGDGRRDDAAAINLALKAAHSQQKNLYFPAGTYLCNTVDKFNHILVFDAGGINGISLYGDGDATKITTSLDAGSILLYVWAYSKSQHLTIKNIFFENRHGLIKNITQGLFLQGTKGQNLNNILLTHCRFEGFSTAAAGQGVNDWTITKNRFGSPKGHDCAKNDTEPAVYLWFFDNQNGYCTDITITNNLADGYTGSAPVTSLVTKRPMDGFVYGTGYGFTITGDTTRNFSEEHYAIAPPSTFPDSRSQILISGNYIDAAIPKGSMNHGGKNKHVNNYGIRCDASNTRIIKNEINNYTTGILVRGVDFPLVNLHSLEISGNTLVSAKDSANYLVNSGIFVQGAINKKIIGVNITGNSIRADQLRTESHFNGILLYDTDSAVVQNNEILVGSGSIKGNSCGISYGRVAKIKDLSNKVTGTIQRCLLRQ